MGCIICPSRSLRRCIIMASSIIHVDVTQCSEPQHPAKEHRYKTAFPSDQTLAFPEHNSISPSTSWIIAWYFRPESPLTLLMKMVRLPPKLARATEHDVSHDRIANPRRMSDLFYQLFPQVCPVSCGTAGLPESNFKCNNSEKQYVYEQHFKAAFRASCFHVPSPRRIIVLSHRRTSYYRCHNNASSASRRIRSRRSF